MTAIEQPPVGDARPNLSAVPSGIKSIAALRVLGVLRQSGSARMGEAAKLSGVSTACITGVVKTMERKRLVFREHMEDDRRVVLIRLTGFGNEIAEAIFAN